MIGQLQNNFRLLASIGAICAVLYSPNIYADDISGNQIIASTDLPVHRNFTVEQIADGIEPGPTGQNGFTTREDSGTITLDFDQAYDIESFKLWNDVVLRAEGVKSFRLDYRTARGMLSSQIFEAAARQADVQIFEFPKISNVLSVDFVILSSHDEPSSATLLPTFAHRIEVREVAFIGKPSNAAPKEDDSATQIAKMKDYIVGLQNVIKEHEADKRGLESDLEKEKRRADSTFALLEQRDATIAGLSTSPTATTTLTLLEEQKTEIAELKAKIEILEGDNPLPKLLLWGAIGLGLSSLFGFLLGRRRSKAILPKEKKLQLQQLASEGKRIKPSFPVDVLKPEGDKFLPVRKQYPEDMRNYDADKGKLIVEAVMGAVVSGSSKLIATQGQIPSAIPAVRKAYHAVGRVGEAQDGVAIGRDKSLGTAILIDENRIMTNRHVFDWNYERIDDPGDPVGVEFFGEKDSDASEFYELTTKDVVIIEEYDAVILTLAKSVPASKRKPIKFSTYSPEHFDESDVYVIGYPAKPAPMTPDIEEAMDGDLVFGVKRFSEGKIYRHPQDTNLEYGIETHTSGNYSEQGWLLAICHQASTLPGNSGSAIISQATGELIGIHFGSDKFDRTLPSHPANVAHSGMFLSHSVTFITSNAFKNYLAKDI